MLLLIWGRVAGLERVIVLGIAITAALTLALFGYSLLEVADYRAVIGFMLGYPGLILIGMALTWVMFQVVAFPLALLGVHISHWPL